MFIFKNFMSFQQQAKCTKNTSVLCTFRQKFILTKLKSDKLLT